ncbi:hypothetical protein LJC13_01380 [Peptostreptococcaceae bacterium OttesenSCG-928-C18]|nr:hypothetical protein [Peptostreptococcaceae bacterium OttesenSCG-928-C18]
MNSKRLAFLSLLAAATIVGRIFFIALPNVQPVTSIIIFSVIYLSLVDAILIDIVIILISNLYLGSGIWTIYQIISYAVIILIAFLLSKIKSFKESILLQGIFAFLSGFIYGFVISVFSALLFSNVNNYWAYLIADVPFNLYHSMGNLVIYLILIPILIKIKNYYFKKESL